MEYGCKGKNVCITGGTSGIGLAVARTLIREGARVLVIGREAAKGARVEQELLQLAVLDSRGTAAGTESAAQPAAAFLALDVSRRENCRQLTAALREFCGRGGLDILVTSAGIYREQPLDRIEEQDYAAMLDTNVAGTLWIIQAAAPVLNEGSSIVTVGSDAGVSGNYGCPLYCASKGAVVALSKALALDLAPRTRVNCVCPGDVATPLVKRQLAQAGGSYTQAEMAAAYPLGRIGTPEEIAHVICAVASPANSFMTGAVIMADGGLTAQ